jgi:hypothetical protein
MYLLSVCSTGSGACVFPRVEGLPCNSIEYGCDYCADDDNRSFGHVQQVASDEDRGFILLQCPRCDALYENTPGGFDETRRLTMLEARRAFPTWSPTSGTSNAE